MVMILTTAFAPLLLHNADSPRGGSINQIHPRPASSVCQLTLCNRVLHVPHAVPQLVPVVGVTGIVGASGPDETTPHEVAIAKGEGVDARGGVQGFQPGRFFPHVGGKELGEAPVEGFVLRIPIIVVIELLGP